MRKKSYRIGNAQTIGSYEIQSNYFATLSKEFVFAVLADGTIDHSNGRRAARIGVETSLREWDKKPANQEILDFFEGVSRKIRERIRELLYLGRTPNVSLSLFYLEKGELFYYSVGENQLFLFRGEEFLFLKDRKGKCRVKKTDTIGLVSKGVVEAFGEMDLYGFLSKEGHPFEKAQGMIEGINQKNIKMAKNATILLIEGDL